MNTLDEAITSWIKEKQKTVADTTFKHLEGMVREWQIWFREILIEDLSADIILNYIQEKEARKTRSASAWNKEKVYFGQVLDTIGKRHILKVWKNRIVSVTREYCPLSREDENKLIAAANERWLMEFIVVGVTTGLRERTIREAQWTWIQNGIMKIPPKAVKNGKKLEIPWPKRARKMMGESGSGPLISGGLPGPSMVWKKFKKAARKAQINPKTSPHDLRRTFLIRLRQSGVRLEEAMKLGGWKTTSTMLTHYFGMPSNAQEIVDQL